MLFFCGKICQVLSVEIFLWMKYNRINCKICVKSAGNSAGCFSASICRACFSDADECIFVKTMSHIRQAEKTLSIESAFNYSDLNGVLLFKLNRGFHTVS